MMSLRELNLKYSYDSSIDDILNDFYIPVLSCSILYKRLVGYFSSNSLAVAARGISRLIRNEGKMKIIAGASLTSNDIEAIVKGTRDPVNIIEESSIRSIEDVTPEFVKNHIKALGWMIANDRLEIKIALPNIEERIDLHMQYGMFHQKIGIFEDNRGHMISFSGSINETAAAWTNNIEEFKVFRSWISEEKKFLNEDNTRFESFWEGKSKKIKIYDIPSAVRDRLITVLDDNIENIIRRLEEYYKQKPRPAYKMISNNVLNLRSYQEHAIKSWFDKRQGIIEMVTGTGKTYVAIGIIKELEKLIHDDKLVVVITVPYIHLITQWEEKLKEWGYDNIYSIDSSKYGNIGNIVWSINNGYKNINIIIVTHNTFCRERFTTAIRDIRATILLIADEVHWLGSPKRREGLLQHYKYKLGLSATPNRYFDEEGTNVIHKYFGNTIFNYTLKEAIRDGYLTPYYYYPYFVELASEESDKYVYLTKKIHKILHTLTNKGSNKQREAKSLMEELVGQNTDTDISIDTDKDDNTLKELERLLINRNRILVNAQGKLTKFKDILDNRLAKDGYDSIKYTLVYCSPQQIDNVQTILNERNIIQHKITAKESKDEREKILKEFEAGTYQVLVAMKVLDEGVDIPIAHTAILLASSTNPREFIQRRGRVLRKYPCKEYATIYDICVIPTLDINIDRNHNIDITIIDKELKRMKEFAESSENPDYTFNELDKILERIRI